MSRTKCQRRGPFAALLIKGAAYLGSEVWLEEGWLKVDGLGDAVRICLRRDILAMTRSRCGLDYVASNFNLICASVVVLVASSAADRPICRFPPRLDF